MISLLTNKQSISGQRYFNINNLALQKSQQQAVTAMLSQANQSSSIVLSLLG